MTIIGCREAQDGKKTFCQNKHVPPGSDPAQYPFAWDDCDLIFPSGNHP